MHPGSTFSEFLEESDLNIKINYRLLNEIYSAGIKNFIYFSSGGTVYGNNGMEVNEEHHPTNPISLYGWYKSAMEQYIRTFTHTHPINYTILRPSNPYGPFQNINGKQGFIAVAMGKILRNETIEIWGDGSAIRDYIYIEDLCHIVSNLLVKGLGCHTFNAGTGYGYSLTEILDVLKAVTCEDIKVTYIKERKVDVKKNILNISLLEKYLNLPKDNYTSLENGINQMWVWLKKQ